MIRLVTQFDMPTARPAAATPTCGSSSCCSCSCCIGTAVASMAFTAMSVHYRGKEREVTQGRREVATMLGLLALPVGIGAGVVAWEATGSGQGGEWPALAVALAAWLVSVTVAYRLVRARNWFGRALGVVAVALVAGFIELFVGVVAQGSAGYIALGLLLGVGAIVIGTQVAKDV